MVRFSGHRLALPAVTAALALALAACGSQVEPEDFLDAQGGGGQVPTNTGEQAVDPETGEPLPPGEALPEGTDPADPQAPGAPSGPEGTGPEGAPQESDPDSPAPPQAGEGAKVGSCEGFKNTTGITDTTITVGTIADVSGAIANAFKANHDGMNAYAAYFNATFPQGICGRKLKVEPYDSGVSANGSAEASRAACKSVFALVGSFSGFDSGGATDTAACGQPDIRSQAAEKGRQVQPTTFQVGPLDTDHMFLQPWIWMKQKIGASKISKSAFVYLNAGAAIGISKNIMTATKKLGYDWEKVIVVDLTSVPNWNAYANQLKDAGITFVQTLLRDYSYKFTAALKQADYKPTVMLDGGVYAQKYIQGSPGADLDGSYLYAQTALMEEANKVPEMGLYQTWLSRTGGGDPDASGAQAWAAGVLFTQLATQLGAKLTRPALIDALKGVHKFTGNGIVTPADVGRGTTLNCLSILQIDGGKFKRLSPFPYTCGPIA